VGNLEAILLVLLDYYRMIGYFGGLFNILDGDYYRMIGNWGICSTFIGG
jgi:hypothetical protein